MYAMPNLIQEESLVEDSEGGDVGATDQFLAWCKVDAKGDT